MDAEIIPPPRKSQTPERADQSKHCQYHINHGHHTEESIALKDQIKYLVQARHLKRFVIDGGIPRRGRSPEQREKGYASRREERFDRRHERRDRRVERREKINCQSPQRRRSRERSLGRPVRDFINTISRSFVGGGTI